MFFKLHANIRHEIIKTVQTVLPILQLLWRYLRLRSLLQFGQAPSEDVGLLFERLSREMEHFTMAI